MVLRAPRWNPRRNDQNGHMNPIIQSLDEEVMKNWSFHTLETRSDRFGNRWDWFELPCTLENSVWAYLEVGLTDLWWLSQNQSCILTLGRFMVCFRRPTRVDLHTLCLWKVMVDWGEHNQILQFFILSTPIRNLHASRLLISTVIYGDLGPAGRPRAHADDIHALTGSILGESFDGLC
jgi:hypothetical protein